MCMVCMHVTAVYVCTCMIMYMYMHACIIRMCVHGMCARKCSIYVCTCIYVCICIYVCVHNTYVCAWYVYACKCSMCDYLHAYTYMTQVVAAAAPASLSVRSPTRKYPISGPLATPHP